MVAATSDHHAPDGKNVSTVIAAAAWQGVNVNGSHYQMLSTHMYSRISWPRLFAISVLEGRRVVAR